MKKEYKIAIVSILAGLSLGVSGMALYQSKVEKTVQKFNQIFLKESGKLPTKDDTVSFYKNHNLLGYIIYESDLTKTPAQNLKLLKIPYSEIERIVKEDKK